MSKEEDERKRKIRSRLLFKGIKEKDANAILANIAHETGGSYDPKQKQRGGPAKGLVQWENPRYTQLEKFASKNKTKAEDLNTQVDFIVHELNTTERGAKKALKKANTVQDKTKVFSDKFERPGKPHMESRLKRASEIEEEDITSRSLYMGGLPKPMNEEEEEEKKEILMEAHAQTKEKGGPVSENMSVHLQDNVSKRSLNMDNIESSGAKAQQAQAEGKQVGIDDKFMSAIGFFLPAVIGGIVGHQTGEAGMGVRLGLTASGEYHKAKNAHQESLAKQKALETKEDFAERRVEVSESNLGLRKKELQAQIDRSEALSTERGDRRYERYTTRASGMKDKFIARNDIKSFREQMESFHSMKEMVTVGKKIPQGALGLVAKGLSGEKGVLTDADIKRAQVNPDIWNKMKRGYYINFKGEINPDDAKELLKIAELKGEKLKERMRKKVGNFAKSRAKHLSKEHGELLGLDLMAELGLEDFEDKEEEKKLSAEEEKEKRYQAYKARRKAGK